MSVVELARSAWQRVRQRRLDRRASAIERRVKRVEAKKHHRRLKTFDEGRDDKHMIGGPGL
jgi:hypothetical protein